MEVKRKKKKNHSLIDAIERIEPVFKISFIASLIMLINYECKFIPLFWDNSITWGLSTVGITILYAFITSFIFYFIIELVPKNKKRAAIFRYVLNNELNIRDRINILLGEVLRIYKPTPGKHKMDVYEFTKQ